MLLDPACLVTSRQIGMNVYVGALRGGIGIHLGCSIKGERESGTRTRFTCKVLETLDSDRARFVNRHIHPTDDCSINPPMQCVGIVVGLISYNLCCSLLRQSHCM